MTELTHLLELSARIGSDPLYTQGSTGNASVKREGSLWIKASGKWMADARSENILVALDLAEVQKCVKENIDPTERYTSASIETAMHAVFPHRVVLHVHCVNTIAWAVRQDAPAQLATHLSGLRWKWIPYVSSGLTLAREIESALPALPGADVLVLGNHGLVLGGEDCDAVERLLAEVQQRLRICRRPAKAADYAALADVAGSLDWELPDDDEVHALGTDPTARSVLAGGILYPCQAIFSNFSRPAELYRAVPSTNGREDATLPQRAAWPFIILEGQGVIVNRSATPAQRAMISGLAQVVQRISASAPIRYLTEAETPRVSSALACRYRELSNANHAVR